MKIALVAYGGSPLTSHPDHHATASADWAASLGKAVAGLGHRVTIYARRDSRALPRTAALAPRLRVEHVSAGPAVPLPPGQLAAHVREFSDHLARRWQPSPPDVAHARSWAGGVATMAGAHGLRVRTVQTFSSLGAAAQRHRLPQLAPETRIRMEGALARQADAVLATSTSELPDLARLGVSRAAVRVVPWGVETSDFAPEGPVARHGDRPRLLAIGALTARHGLGTAIRALADVPAAELVIAGGPARTQLRADPGYQELLRLASAMRVRNRVKFLGRCGAARLPALLRSADVLVNTAWYEPTGLPTIQAMACGLPVVVSAVGAHTDVVLDATTGYLVPPGQPGPLARRIRQLLASPVRREAYGIAAADRARSRYSWERIGRETLAAYQPAHPAAALTGRAARATPRGVPAAV